MTNGEIATLIEGLTKAINFVRTLIDSECPPKGVPLRDWEPCDREQLILWKAELKRYRFMRARFLRMEKRR